MRNEKIWRCDCGSDHFLSVIFYDDDPEGYVSLVDGTHCTSFWCKVKAAWQIIRTGNSHHFGVEVVLNPGNSKEIGEAILEAGRKIGEAAK